MFKDYNLIININPHLKQPQDQGNLYLGAVSMLRNHHHKELAAKNIGSVLSII